MRRWRTRVAARALRLLSSLFGRLSWRGAQRLGAGLGWALWWLALRDRRRTLTHLAIAFADLAPRQRAALGRRCFRHHGESLGEALHLLHRGCGSLLGHVRIEGLEELERARRAGRPVLLVSAHCGNWELLHAAVNASGIEMPVVVRRLDDPGLDELLAGLRARLGTETIARGAPQAGRALLRSLRRGVVGVMIDQDTRVEGLWVPFFGRPAYTPLGPAQLARRVDAAVVVAFIERLADGSHLLRLQSPLPAAGDPEELTGRLTRAVEEQVRRVPEQWVWMHRRWRRQPPEAS